MNNLTKLEVAKETLNCLIATICAKGFTTQNKTLNILLLQKQKLENFDFKIADKILKIYCPIVKKERLFNG